MPLPLVGPGVGPEFSEQANHLASNRLQMDEVITYTVDLVDLGPSPSSETVTEKKDEHCVATLSLRHCLCDSTGPVDIYLRLCPVSTQSSYVSYGYCSKYRHSGDRNCSRCNIHRTQRQDNIFARERAHQRLNEPATNPVQNSFGGQRSGTCPSH